MTQAWVFRKAAPGDRARESQVEKFFSSDAVKNPANALVREGIQNSLDAAMEGQCVGVRIAIGEWRNDVARQKIERYATGLFSHLNAPGVAESIRNPPNINGGFRYLAFEDFGTSGLLGDVSEWWPDESGSAGAFFKYFREEGISGKGDGARGRHGVGRLVFMFASRARAMFGLTVRVSGGDAQSLLMGTAVLRNHRLQGAPYLPDGWFGVSDESLPGLVLPVGDQQALDRFREDFCLSRRSEPGLSVVVPWLSDEVHLDGVVEAVLSEYFYPVLSGRLKVEIVAHDHRVVIDRESIATVVAQRPESESRRISPLLRLAEAAICEVEWLTLNVHESGAPRWVHEVIGDEVANKIIGSLDNGERVFIEVPVVVRAKGKSEARSNFRICLERDSAISESEIYFIREGIMINDVRPRRTAGYRALVISEKGALGEFLGDAENPSHTQWHKDAVKDRYTFAPGLLEYVVQSVPSVLLHVGRKKSEPDSSLLIDMFALKAVDGPLRTQRKKDATSGHDPEKPHPEVRKLPRSYVVGRRSSGFFVKQGDANAPRLSVLTVRVAYDVRRGNPFAKFNSADFVLGEGGLELHCRECEVVSMFPNIVVLRITGDDFEFAVDGFDVSTRDLCVDVKAVRAENQAPVDGAGAH